MLKMDDKEKFYDDVAKILDIDHTYVEPVPKRTRWNTRNLGNGRFPGFGTVHHFGSFIRVISRKHGTTVHDDSESALEYLRNL